MIGDAGVNNSDVSYAGSDGQYFIDRARAFQEVMIAVDMTANAVYEALGVIDSSVAGAQIPETPTVSVPVYDAMGNQTGYEDVMPTGAAPADMSDIQSTRFALQKWLDDFEAKKFTFRTTAEAINLAAQGLNAVGGRFPELSIPSGLSAAPIVVGAGIAAAIAAAVALIRWGIEAIDVAKTLLSRAQAYAAVRGDPQATAALAAAYATADAAAAKAKASGMGTLSTVLMWGGLAVLAFIAYRAYSASRGD